jgi:hypothetical protein
MRDNPLAGSSVNHTECHGRQSVGRFAIQGSQSIIQNVIRDNPLAGSSFSRSVYFHSFLITPVCHSRRCHRRVSTSLNHWGSTRQRRQTHSSGKIHWLFILPVKAFGQSLGFKMIASSNASPPIKFNPQLKEKNSVIEPDSLGLSAPWQSSQV